MLGANSTADPATDVDFGGHHWPIVCDAVSLGDSLYDVLCDACAAHLLGSHESYVFLYISLTPAHDKACIVRVPPNAWGPITITTHPIPDYIPIDFAFATEDQREATRRSYEYFAQWSRRALTGDAPRGAILIVKLTASCRWFMRFPFNSYINYAFGEFSRYSGAQWIVSSRSLSVVIANRMKMRDNLADLEELLNGTLIILNTYHHHLISPVGDSVLRASGILESLLVALQQVQVGSESLSLRYLVNPSASCIRHELSNSRTRFVFAAFEARSGSWEIASTNTADSEPEYFNLSQLRDRLAHVQLLRIFHCYSAFRPGIESEPADPDTLAGQLLGTGAQMVEGGITEESYFDFTFAVLQFLLRTNLRTALEARQTQGSLDLASIVASANEMLTQRGYEPIGS